MPEFGSAARQADGSIRYFPPKGFIGEDCFAYRSKDISGFASDEAGVCVRVMPTSLQIPEVFTPNGDGINEVLLIEHIDMYPSNTIYIYDRNRNLVYSEAGYANAWDGKSQDGSLLPPGTYFIALDLDTSSERDRPLRGYTTIHR